MNNEKGVIGVIVAGVALGTLVVVGILAATQHFIPNLIK